MTNCVLNFAGSLVQPPFIEGYHFIGYKNPMLAGDLIFSPHVDKYQWDYKNAVVTNQDSNGEFVAFGEPFSFRSACGLYRKTCYGYAVLNDPSEIIQPQDFLFWADIYFSNETILKSILMKQYSVDIPLNGSHGKSLAQQSKDNNREVHIYRKVCFNKRILNGNKHYQKVLPLP